jgi:hypothetical protein
MPQVEVNGQKMYIPQSGMKQFTQDFPDANIHYTVGKDTLSIPYKNSKAFLNDYPDATTIGDDTEQQSPTVPLAFEAPQQQNEQVSGVMKPKDVRALAPELEGKLDFTPQKTRSTNEFDDMETGVASPKSIIKEKTINQDPYFITSQSISSGIERASKGQLDTYKKNDTKTYGAAANYMDAKNIYQEADDTMNAKGGLGSGMSDKAMDENTWFMGIPKIGELLKTKSLIDKLESGKQLTDDEDVLLDAVATLAQANLIKDKQTSAAYKGGAGITEMVPFIAQMAMTGGLGKLALSGGEKALVRYLGSKIASKMGLRLAELGVKAASKVGQAAIGASIAPMTAQGTLENMQGKIAPTIENNEIAYNKGVNEFGDAVGREDQMSAGDAYLDAFENTAKEFVTEMSGGSVGVLGKIATAVPGIEKLFAKVAQSGFGKVGKAIFANDYFKKAGIHGLLGEYNEEVDGALYDHIRGKENINKFFNWDSQAQLLYTLVPVSAFGGAMSLGAKIQGVSAFNKSDKNLTQLLRSEGYSNEDIETIKMGLLDATPQDAGNQLSAIISNMKNGVIEADGQRGINNELAQPFLDFMIQGQRQNAINQGLQSRKESFDNDVRTAATESIAQVDSTINPATGTIVMAEINGQPAPISGNAVFLEDGTLDLENSDETLSYKDEEGNVIPIAAKDLVNPAQIDPVQARTEAVSAATAPIIQQQKNEDAPEFEVGEYVRHENGMISGEITAITPNGYMVKSLTQGEIEVQGGNLINDKHVSGLKSKEEVEYTENGETKVGIVDDIESGRSKGTVDLLVEVNGKQIPKTVNYDQIVGKKVEKEVESAEVPAGSTNKMIVEPSVDETLSGKQSPEAVIPITEDVVEPEIEPETKQEPEAPTEPEKTLTYNEQIPKKKVGKKTATDYESVAPGITLGALREDFEESDIKELVSTKIKDIEKQIKAVGEVKKIADFDLYKANVKAAKEKVDSLNKQLEYWNSVKEEAKPKNKVEVAEIPIRESRDERYDRWGEPRSLRELIMYHFVGGMKLRWNDIKTDDGKVLSRGMGAEYRYDNGERLTRIGLTSNDGLTPEQYADKLWGANGYEKGSFEEMDLSGEDTTSILSEIQSILNEYASTGQMIAAINEDRAQLSKEEQAYLDQAIFEADNNIDNLSDDIYAAVLGLTEFTEEQLNELNNILQNETNETTEGTSPTAIEETESIESDNEGQESSESEGVVGESRIETKPKDTPKTERKVDKFLSEKEFIEIGISDYVVENELNEDEFSESEEFDDIFNGFVDKYSEYITELKNNGKLQEYFDNAKLNEKIAIRKGIQTAGFEVEDMIDLNKEKAQSKKQRDDVKAEKLKQTMKAIGIEQKSTEQIQSETDLNPTEAQKEAGNYKKAHITVSGMDISIENPVGSIRSGKDEDGKAWEHEMKSHYGYYKGTVGKDGDHIDVFIKEGIPTDWNGSIFPIDQINPKTGEFDETKVMLGYNTADEAKAAYMENYDANWKGFSAITEVNIDDFKTWLYDGKKQRKPFNEYKDTQEQIRESEKEQELNPVEKVNETLGQRNIWIPNMTKSKLSKLLNKDVLTENDIEDLKDFQYFLLTDKQSATEKGFYDQLAVSQQGEAYVLKDKFLLTNIENKLNPSNISSRNQIISDIANKKIDAVEGVKKLDELKNDEVRFAVVRDEADKKYFDAIERGDMEIAQRIIDQQAVKNGYVSQQDYRLSHRAPSADTTPSEEKMDVGGDFSLTEIANGYSSQPLDYFDTRNGARWYGYDYYSGRQSQSAINSAIRAIKAGENPTVTIYRAVEKSLKEGSIRNGDWITLSEQYAKEHGQQHIDGAYKIQSMEVPASDIWWDGNDINEWGYDNGEKYAYANTLNNRKLTDVITRDDNGDIVPPSKRFNKRKSDVVFEPFTPYPTKSRPSYAVSETGFYSTVEKALQAIQQEKGTKDQFRAMLLKNGAKQAEMDWMGFDELPEKLTKADIQNWIDEKRIEVQEVEKGAIEQLYTVNDEDGYIIGDAVTLKEAEDFISEHSDMNLHTEEADYRDVQTDDTKFSQYTLPGGENYKELLLIMPQKPITKPYEQWLKENYYGEDRKEARDLYAQQIEPSSPDFKSSHYDEPNILAHVRFNERTVNGEKVLFIEEFQSDWNQRIKKEGGAKNEKKSIELKNQIDNLLADYSKLSTEEKYNEIGDGILAEKAKLQLEYDLETRKNTPDNPFKKTDQWVNLAARRMMRYAAENGFDRIAWTNGEQQADRYSLAKQVSKIRSYKTFGGGYYVTVRDINGRPMDDLMNEYSENELPDTFGKEIAKNIIENSGGKDEQNPFVIEGEGLKVGGQGMKAFYDAIVPSAMSKLGKPFGAKVETIDLSDSHGYRMWEKSTGKYLGEFRGSYLNILDNGETERKIPADYKKPAQAAEELGLKLSEVTVKYDEQHETGLLQQQSIPVTEAMKQSALEGMPLFEPITAYHGSPHKFDRFSTQYTGSGEGQQAYGWGLYFTDKKAIAKQYAGMAGGVIHNKLYQLALKNGFDSFRKYDWQLDEFANSVMMNKGDFDKALSNIKADVEAGRLSGGFKSFVTDLELLADKIGLDTLKSELDKARNIYTVKIKEVNDLNFLRWDKEITPEQIDKINTQLKSEGFESIDESLSSEWIGDNVQKEKATGEKVYYIIGHQVKEKGTYGRNDKEASLFLLRAGIDGIKYPAEYTSKGTHEEAFNYVVFDENAVEINEHLMFEPTQLFITFTPEEIKDETEKAHGSEEKQQEGIDKTIAEATLLPTNTGSTDTGRRGKLSPISEKRTVIEGFKESGVVNFNGTKVSSHQDIADLWSIHRSPYIEKSHVIFIKDGVVVGSMAVSSGSIKASKVSTPQDITEHANKIGANQVYFLHNHPSGNHKVSYQDVHVTFAYADRLRDNDIQVLGHVVVDHDKYSFIDTVTKDWVESLDKKSLQDYADNQVDEFEYKGGAKPQLFEGREFLGNSGNVQDRLFEYGKNILSQPNYGAAIVYMQSKKEIGFSVAAYDIIPKGATKEDIKRIAAEGLNNNLGANAVIIHDGSIKGSFGRVHADIVDIIDTKNGSFANDFVNESTVEYPKTDLWVHQIIGEYGARNLDAMDAAQRLDNLRVAKEMEATKTPQEIRLATGWEKGVDGLWRYEVPDVELDSYIKKDHHRIRQGRAIPLSDVISKESAKLLFKLYPKLEHDVQVLISGTMLKSESDNGAFSPKADNQNGLNKWYDYIKINIKDIDKISEQEFNEKVKSILIHEIQHAIQDIEGFAKGGNINTDTDTNSFETYNFNSREAKAIIQAKEDFKNTELGKEIQYALDNKSNNLYKLLGDRNTLNEDWKFIVNAENNFKKENGILPKEYIDKYPTFDNYAAQQYRRLAGEVEARNASTRMNFTEDERRAKLLSETADVLDVDQIVVMNEVGTSMSIDPSGNLPTGENRDELDAKLKRSLFGLNDRLASLSEVGEGWVDKWLPVKEMEDLMESKGTPITDATSYYRQSTHIAPRIMARQQLYQENVFKPLQRAISALMDKGVTYNEVEVYAMVKHGVEERNPYFNDKNGTTDVDYSGVTAFEAKHGNLTDLIANFEAKVGDEALKEFWKQKKNNTDFSIDVEIEAGTITRDFGNELKARWAHYMPLRGFDEITAAEKYEYNPSIGTYFSAPMQKIKGRTSEATMPFAYIQQMAHSSISKAQKNEAKKTIDKLERVDETGILKRGKSWYEYVGEVNGMKTFEAAEPTYSEDPQEFENNINEFEQRMQALRKDGKAYEKNDSAFDLGVAFIRPTEKEQHAVRVIVQGEEKVIYIMSNPRISRAINGINVVHTGNVTGAFSAANRWMAQNFTTRNPVFIATNAERDTLWSQFAVIAKEDATYLGQFEKNIAHSLNTLRKVMFGKAATNDKYAKYYQEYLINGAMTGFSQTLAIETIQKDIEKAIKKGENVSWSKALANYIDASNKMVENANRFAAYITSREQGRSIIASVNDAKELTVNWDRSGSGAMGNMETKAVVLFANAAIQGLNTSVKIAKVAPKVTTAVIAGLIISGLTNAMLVGLMGGDDAEEAYMNVSSIKRRDNYMIYSPTTGLFHNIALPQNLRVFHGFGSDLYLAMKGKADLKESFINLMNGVLDFLPMNPYESVSYLNSDGVKGFVGSVSSNVSVLYPVMQHALNRDYLNHTILNEWNDRVDMPGFMKARTNKRGETLAPAWLMWASEKLNDLGGGDRVTPGEIIGLKLSFNPDVANHYLRGYFGGMYNITQQAATTLYKTGEAGYKSLEKGELVAPDIKLRETPIGTFAVDPADIMQRNTTTNNKYFDIKTDIEERYRKRNEYNDEYSNDRAAKVVGTRKLGITRKTDEIKALIKTISEFEGRLNEKYPEWKKDKWQKDINDLKKKVIKMHEKAPE